MGKNECTYKPGYNGTLEERMENKTIKSGENDCWLWTAACDTAGYPTIRVNHKLRRASHIAFQLHNGKPIPNGMVIMHACDTPLCVNPRHLFLGTKKLNNLDKKQKGRGNPRYGENHPMSKLSASDVEKIRSIFCKGEHTFTSIAAAFNVNRTTISRIINRKKWS